MRWTVFSLLTMATVFLVRFINKDVVGRCAACVPFSSSRAYPATVVFELSLLAQVALAVYLLANVRRWGLEGTEVVEPPLSPRQYVRRGFLRIGVLAVANLLALWAVENADAGLRFRDLITQTLGISSNYLENVAAFCTLAVVLTATVVSVYLFFGAPRATTPSMAPPVPPAPTMIPPGPRPPGPVAPRPTVAPPPPLRRP